MDGPVIFGAELIRIIDENGGMYWRVDGVERFLCPPNDASQLQVGTRLIWISASLRAMPRHYKVASPLFLQRGTWMVVLEPDASRNCDLPGSRLYLVRCRAVAVHTICPVHGSKTYKLPQGMRFLVSG